jgi:hypothetical protein
VSVAANATVSLPSEVRALLEAPNYVHLATLRADASPRNHVVWVGLEDDCVLVGSVALFDRWAGLDRARYRLIRLRA